MASDTDQGAAVAERVTVRSADGTPLSVSRRGSGSPMVLVHGLCGQPHDFALLAPLLAERHEVWTYARRGRGGSGDTLPYALDREVEDVHAVLEATGGPAHLVGHSLGGLLATLAAPDADLASLILYEPALRPDRVDPDARHRGEVAVATGDLDLAIQAFADLAGITDGELALIRSVPVALEGMRDSARLGPRECEAIDQLDLARWRDRPIDVPALVLSGELTSVEVYAGEDDLADVLPRGTFESIPGQHHLAPVFAAPEVARRILAFTATLDN